MKKRKNETEPIERGPKMVVGLDIGTTKIVMVMGYLCDDGKVEVCGSYKVPSIGVESGLIQNLQDTIDAITTVKGQVEEMTGQQVSDVYVGVAGRHIRSVKVTNSLTRINGHEEIIRKEEIDKMTADMENLIVNFGQVITVIPQSYNVDGVETLRADGMVGQNVTGTFQMITGNAQEIRKIIMSVQKSGLRMSKPLLEPQASSISCLTEEEKRNGVALIDIGGGTTDLIIYRSGVPVYIRVIPVGGKVITKDIESFGMTYEEAEQIKIEHGSCIPENADKNHFITLKDSVFYGQNVKINEFDLAKAINARVKRDILEVIKSEIEKSGYFSDVKRLVITGGGARLKDIKGLAEFVLQKKARIGIPGVGFTPTLESHLKDPIYSTALGLLAYGCKTEGTPYSPDGAEENEDEVSDNDENTVEVNPRPGLVDIIGRSVDQFAKKIMKSLTETNNGEGVD